MAVNASWTILGMALGPPVLTWLGMRMFREGQTPIARASSQAMFGILALGWSLLIVALMNAGLQRSWALEWRLLLGLATVLGMVWGIGQILAAGTGLLIESFRIAGSAQQDDDPYWLAWLGPATLVFVVMIATMYLQRRVPTTAPRATLIAVGGFLVAAAVVWPRWFSEHFLVDELLHRLPPGLRRPILGAAGFLGIIVASPSV